MSDFCEIISSNEQIVGDTKDKLIKDETASRLSEFFKIFGDNTRLKIIHAISLHELCVCDIALLLDISQSAASHQLKTLRQFNLVKTRKSGKMVYYSLSDNHVRDIFNEGLIHISE